MVSNCSPGHDASIGTQHDLTRSILQVDLSNTLRIMVFVMTSDDLNIDLTQTSFFTQKLYFLQRTIKRRLPFVTTIRGFRDLKEGRKGPPPRPISSL